MTMKIQTRRLHG